MKLAVFTLGALLALTGCEVVRNVSPVERGEALFRSPAFARTVNNQFACSTCHEARPGEARGLTLAGAVMAGVTRRPVWWSGEVPDLTEAIAVCYRQFMRGGEFDPASDDAVALYAFLDSLASVPGAVTTAVPFTVVRATRSPRQQDGDAQRGAALYAAACRNCHGELRTTTGQLGDASLIPTDTEAAHTAAMNYDEVQFRQVFVEKIRHGSFLGYAGVMPPFSREVLSDQDVIDIVAYIDPTRRVE